MPWPPATGRPRRLAEAEMGSIQRSGIPPPIGAGPSGPCLTSVRRSRRVGTSAVVNVFYLPVSLFRPRVNIHHHKVLFIWDVFTVYVLLCVETLCVFISVKFRTGVDTRCEQTLGAHVDFLHSLLVK